MQVLAIGAHFDDVELGCGGTLAAHAEAGDSVHILIATASAWTAPDGRAMRDAGQAAAEGRAAAAILGAAEVVCAGLATNTLAAGDPLSGILRGHIDRIRPELVYTHWSGDAHPDHRALAAASLGAARHVPGLLAYRSNLYAGERAFNGVLRVDISHTLERKQAALRAHASEWSRVGRDWLASVIAQNLADGGAIGVGAAECFEVVKFRWQP